jgi:nitroreductase
MDVMTAIDNRHSCRMFDGKPVPREVIDRLLHAAAQAPSPMNTQPWRFHIATDKTREALGEVMALTTVHLQEYIDMIPADRMEFIGRFYSELGLAPVILAVAVPQVADDVERVNTYVSAGCALENVLLAAGEFGIGCCSITAPVWVRDKLMGILEIADDWEIVALVLLGYAAEPPVAPEHKQNIAVFHH